VDGRSGSSNGRFFAIAGYVLMLGFSLAVSALVGLYVGSLLDRGRAQKIFTPIGLLVGLALGFHRSWLVLKRILEKQK